MSLTLGELRTYCQEVASKNTSSAAGDRWIRRWINNALARICSEHSWTYYNRATKISTHVEETGTGLTATLNSREVSLSAGTFDQKWLDEKWAFHIDGEDRVTFQLVEITSPTTAKFKVGQEWPNATSAVLTFTVARHIYELETPAKRILRCEDAFSSYPLISYPPAEFDKVRQWSPTQRSQATHYTVRHGRLEIWPAPSTDVRIMAISYLRATPKYDLAAQDDNDTVVDWDPNFDDLLLKAILVEAALTQGKRAPISYSLASSEYRRRVNQCKGDDANVVDISGVIEDHGSGRGGASFERLTVTDWP